MGINFVMHAPFMVGKHNRLWGAILFLYVLRAWSYEEYRGATAILRARIAAAPRICPCGQALSTYYGDPPFTRRWLFYYELEVV